MATKKKTTTPETASEAPEKKPRSTRSKKTAEEKATTKKPRAPRKKKEASAPEVLPTEETPIVESSVAENIGTEAPLEDKSDEPKTINLPISDKPKAEQPKPQQKPAEPKPTPPCPTLLIRNIVELINAPQRQLLINDQQIQQLSLEEAQRRFRWIEGTLALVLNYDIVLSDTNIWLELLTGHTSSHSDPRYNCRLQFERQLEFISRLTQYRGGRFMMMSETYEEIDRFATQMDPVSHKEADFTDDDVCRNIAGRLAKKLILSQQRENRLRIEGIGSESHHSSFADPAIIRRCVELFAIGKKVLLLTNDASVAIRSMGMCDDLQRTNNIDDELWDNVYAPLRPMVMTFDDLKVLDAYTRQYHFLQMAAGKSFMEDVPQCMEKHNVEHLELWLEGFRPGDRYSEKKQQQMQLKQNSSNGNQQKQSNNQPKQQKQQKAQPKKEQQKQEQQKMEQKVAEQKSVPQTTSVEQKPVDNPILDNQQPIQPAPQQPIVEEPRPSLISPEEAAVNEQEKKQEQKQKRRAGRRGGRKPKNANANANANANDNNAPAIPAE